MGNIVICDDDENIAIWVENELRSIFAKNEVEMETKVFTSPKEALQHCSKYKTDFIILDIDMPEMSGFELTKRLYKFPSAMVPIVIYMSSMEQFVYDAFQYKPFDFLRKSCIEEELEQKIGRLIREYDYNNIQIELIRDEDAHLLLKEVIYFKSIRNSVDAFTAEDSYRCRDNLIVIEEMYPNCLIKTNRQHLVNVNYIKRIRTDYVLMKNGIKVPLSRRKRKDVEERYERLSRK